MSQKEYKENNEEKSKYFTCLFIYWIESKDRKLNLRIVSNRNVENHKKFCQTVEYEL